MRLMTGRITKREVRKPTRKYVRRMAIPRNRNGEQPFNSTGEGTIMAISIEPIPFIASTTAIPSMTITPLIMQEGTIFPPSDTQSHSVTPRPIMVREYRPFARGFTMPLLGV